MFVFGLKKVSRNEKPASILVVYYPQYGIWNEFELLEQDGTPYVQQEQALYIKDAKRKIVYGIGGKIDEYK